METLAVCGERMSKQVSDVPVYQAHIEYKYVPRMTDEQITLHAHLRLVRTALIV
jgi:hypothetical protein